MSNFRLLIFILTLVWTLSSQAKNSEKLEPELLDRPFLQPHQTKQLYHELIGFIEAYDAEGIVTRELTKKVGWDAYKKAKQSLFINSENWQQLKHGFEQLTAGFVNLHSRFKFNLKSKRLKGNIKLGFTYPQISFFNQENQQKITSINQQVITEVFHEFEQFNCAFNSKIGCLRSFIGRFHQGRLLVGNQPVSSIQQNNTPIQVEFKTPESAPKSTHFEAIKTDQYLGWELMAKGHKIALFEQPGLLLLKIKNFSYEHGSGADFRCLEPAIEKSMCADIQLIRNIFNEFENNKLKLIIDVQNNTGGRENTAFIAELSQAPFQDLTVKFRNSDLLEDPYLRGGLFYGSSGAEKWFQQLSDAHKAPQQEWLPPRADFCRGDLSCQLRWINPNNKPRFKGIYLLTNEHCISSCDDLVWRLSEFSNAQVFGLPQAADATYSRISVTFFIDENDQVQHKIHPDGAPSEVDGLTLFSMTIPYSQTIKHDGSLRQGSPADTKFLLPITVENFDNHELDSLNYLAIKIRAGKF